MLETEFFLSRLFLLKEVGWTGDKMDRSFLDSPVTKTIFSLVIKVRTAVKLFHFLQKFGTNYSSCQQAEDCRMQ